MAHDCYIGDSYLSSSETWTNSVPTTNSNSYSSSSSYSTGSSTSDNKSQTAYLSETGSKYHSISNCGRMNPNNATKTTVGEAEAAGFARYSKCWYL